MAGSPEKGKTASTKAGRKSHPSEHHGAHHAAQSMEARRLVAVYWRVPQADLHRDVSRRHAIAASLWAATIVGFATMLLAAVVDGLNSVGSYSVAVLSAVTLIAAVTPGRDWIYAWCRVPELETLERVSTDVAILVALGTSRSDIARLLTRTARTRDADQVAAATLRELIARGEGPAVPAA